MVWSANPSVLFSSRKPWNARRTASPLRSSRQIFFAIRKKIFPKPVIVFTVCQEKFVTNLLTYITNFVTRVTKFLTCVTKFVTKTLLFERKNYLVDSKNYLADSGAWNGLLGEGVGKDVCRKCGQLSQEMDDQFQDKTQPVISDGFEVPTIHSQPVWLQTVMRVSAGLKGFSGKIMRNARVLLAYR